MRLLAVAIAAIPLGLAAALPAAAPASDGPCRDRPSATAVRGNDLCLAFKMFGAAGEPGRTLVVLLHGDLSGGGTADGMAARAASVAAAEPSVLAVALARPGYAFGDGTASTGSANGRRDHYTAANIDAVADAIRRLKAAHRPARTVVAGHSGGAATAGVIAGRHPDTADAYVLLSCPCDVAAWRAGRGSRGWKSSLSPSDFVAGVPPAARVIAVTGANDDNAPGDLARAYVDSLRQRGIDATYRDAPGAGHSLGDTYWNSGALDAVLRAVKG
jgi:pimeloyl-ACP methyl ester carboxylesterase